MEDQKFDNLINDGREEPILVPAYIIGASGTATIIIGSENYSVTMDHANYEEIMDALRDESYEGLVELIDIGSQIRKASDGRVCIENGIVYYNSQELHNSLTKRILALRADNYPFEFLVRFLENLLMNPSVTAREELYEFLEVNDMPITTDGHFLAYRKVDENYLDFYTCTIDNSIGSKPSMDRSLVDNNRDNTCSTGFHFCSLKYLPSYHSGEGHVMIVKINPQHTVSFPTDYGLSKGRCCEYEVVDEHHSETEERFTKSAYNADGSDINEEVCEDCGALNEYCKCEVCSECGENELECSCTFCGRCGYRSDSCSCESEDICDGCRCVKECCECDICDYCGEYYEDCLCDDEDNDNDDTPPDNILSRQSKANSYHSRRDNKGRFVKASTPLRDNKGRFASHDVAQIKESAQFAAAVSGSEILDRMKQAEGRGSKPKSKAKAKSNKSSGAAKLQKFHNIRDSKGRFVKS